MLVLGPLGPRGHQVGEPEPARRLVAAGVTVPFASSDVLPGRHPPLEVLADVVQVEVDGRPAPPGDPVLRGRLEHEVDGRAVERVALDQLLEQLIDVVDHPPIVGPRASRRQPVGGHPSGQRWSPVRAIVPALPRARSHLVRPLRGWDGQRAGIHRIGKGHACRTICRPASTSRRWRPGPVRSRAWARPSPRSSDWRPRAREHADPGHELEPVHVHVRRLRRGLVPRPCRLRLLPERRWRRLRRARRRRRGRPDRQRRAAELVRQGEARLPRRGPRSRAGGQRHHRRRPAARARRAPSSSSSSAAARRSSRSTTCRPPAASRTSRPW